MEQEQNGIYFYDRAPKYDVLRLRAINQRPAAYETQPPRVRRLAWRTFRADATDFALAALKLHHDEDTEIFLNGQPVAVFTGYVTDYFTTPADALARAIVVGDNLLAIHCRNTVGGQFIDAGIEIGTELKKP